MLDFRHETFLALCHIKSYTKTAQALHITQPAVTQHIKALEAHYGNRLFTYRDRTLTLTEHGELLYRFVSTVAADSDNLVEALRQKAISDPPLRFGATLSIGQYIMPGILQEILRQRPGTQVTMLVENTHHLLEKLGRGEIQFALIEGLFDKGSYHAQHFAAEPFVGVCAKGSPLVGYPLTLGELTRQNLIVREEGSGTREIFEHLLQSRNLSFASFARVTEIGNMEAIKALVEEGLGVTFLYRAAVREELEREELCLLDLPDFREKQELSFVFLKNSHHTAVYLDWLAFFQRHRQDDHRASC